MEHVGTDELEAGLRDIRRSPRDVGHVELVVRRPAENEREVLDEATLDPASGLVGDMWSTRRTESTADGSPNPDMQLTLMNVRVAGLVAADLDRRQLAGDQLFVDFDLSLANVPAGTRLEIGSALVEVTAEPHRGCGKFAARFGVDALKFVNSAAGRKHNLRGVNARVLGRGDVRPGDPVRKVPSAR